jgi:hypothetical protein
MAGDVRLIIRREEVFIVNNGEPAGMLRNLPDEDIRDFERRLCASLRHLRIDVLDRERCPGTNILFLSALCPGPLTTAFHLKLCSLLEQMNCVLVAMEECLSADMHCAKIICFGQAACPDQRAMNRSEGAVPDCTGASGAAC